MLRAQYTHVVYPVGGYKFGQKGARPEKEGGGHERLGRMRAKFDREGMRRSVEAVLLVQQHGHPHVLMLQLGSSNYFKLPGGKLKPGEDEIEGLRRKLVAYMSPEDAVVATPWEVGECVGVWYRPNFDTVLYPYLPPHVTRPKEIKKLFIVPLLDKSCFAVPSNYRLVAVPLFELFDNAARFGPVNSSIPQMLCRLRLNMIGGPAAAGAPAKPATAAAAAQAAAAAGQQQHAAAGGGAAQMEAEAY